MTQNNSAFLFQHRAKFLLLASQNLNKLENPFAIQFYSQHKHQEVPFTHAEIVSELKKCCQNAKSQDPLQISNLVLQKEGGWFSAMAKSQRCHRQGAFQLT